MSAMWDEVSKAQRENRRELVLQGQEISKRINKNGIDSNVFKLIHLNYLEISGTALSALESGFGELVNLTSLLLCNNQLEDVSPDIGKLTKLKILNLSNNKIKTVPEEICSIKSLDTLNLSMNELTDFPSIRDLKSIHIFNLSNNQLTSLPDGIYEPELVHLSQILASDNHITELSSDIEDLPHLNKLDLSNNKLSAVPSQLCICPKLKELNLKGNKFKDRRFGKLVEQCAFKSVTDYLQANLKKENQKAGKGKEKETKGKKKKKGKKVEDEVEELAKNMISVLRFPSETGIVVQVTQAVLPVRQYIVCCLVKNLDLQSGNNFKNFITLQTRLHDTVCQKRQAATIATHEFQRLKLPLTYDAKLPHVLQIVPLFRQKEVSGEKLVRDLRSEAEEVRKEKKRNTFSGIHKYLDLLADKTHYPCLVMSDDNVISFPPITNSEKTKISKETTSILVEVTSSTSLDTCKKVADELLYKMLEMELGGSSKGSHSAGAAAKGGDSDSSSEDSDAGVVFESNKKPVQKLVIEQVKVTDYEGGLKVIYPSRTDLCCDTIEVVRHFD